MLPMAHAASIFFQSAVSVHIVCVVYVVMKLSVIKLLKFSFLAFLESCLRRLSLAQNFTLFSHVMNSSGFYSGFGVKSDFSSFFQWVSNCSSVFFNAFN